MNLYTTFDTVTKKYGPIFQAVNEREAMRICYFGLKDIPEVTLPELMLVWVAEFDADYDLINSGHDDVCSFDYIKSDYEARMQKIRDSHKSDIDKAVEANQ